MDTLLCLIVFFTPFMVSASFSQFGSRRIPCSNSNWNDFRGTFGTFSSFPTSISHELIVSEKWTQVSRNCKNNGLFYGFQFARSQDNYIRLLFDIKGIIAGIQYLIPKREVLTTTNRLNYGRIPVHQNATYDGVDYFISTVYLINPSIICKSGRSRYSLISEGTGTGLWIQNGSSPSQLIQVANNRPTPENDEDGDGWSIKNCVPGMGIHSFNSINRSGQTNCTEFFPFAALYSKYNKLHGIVFISVGNFTSLRFEDHPDPERSTLNIVGKNAPQCIYDLFKENGVSSLHVYFKQRPWNITCPR